MVLPAAFNVFKLNEPLILCFFGFEPDADAVSIDKLFGKFLFCVINGHRLGAFPDPVRIGRFEIQVRRFKPELRFVEYNFVNFLGFLFHFCRPFTLIGAACTGRIPGFFLSYYTWAPV